MTPALFSLLLGFSFFVTAWILGEMFDPSSSDSFIFLFGKKIDVSALSSSGTIFYYAELAVYAIVGLLLGLYSLISVGKSEKKNKTNALDQRADALVKQRVNQIQSEKRKMEQSAADKASDKLDNINIIEEYKKMLDDGIITQEEFEKKKKEFLEL
ncbi:MAG: hypothetical protein E7642_00785 [Ruminococcaceae bacterium]|nr:hypothetical protein [Oscillospiraceae bacterium]